MKEWDCRWGTRANTTGTSSLTTCGEMRKAQLDSLPNGPLFSLPPTPRGTEEVSDGEGDT